MYFLLEETTKWFLPNWSPFEHQAQATALVDETTSKLPTDLLPVPKGMEVRVKLRIKMQAYMYRLEHWSHNFNGWKQSRTVLEDPTV